MNPGAHCVSPQGTCECGDPQGHGFSGDRCETHTCCACVPTPCTMSMSNIVCSFADVVWCAYCDRREQAVRRPGLEPWTPACCPAASPRLCCCCWLCVSLSVDGVDADALALCGALCLWDCVRSVPRRAVRCGGSRPCVVRDSSLGHQLAAPPPRRAFVVVVVVVCFCLG
eukprot:SAG11_NODE_1173_length_5602_cov_35.121933_7_plen_170_part_00